MEYHTSPACKSKFRRVILLVAVMSATMLTVAVSASWGRTGGVFLISVAVIAAGLVTAITASVAIGQVTRRLIIGEDFIELSQYWGRTRLTLKEIAGFRLDSGGTLPAVDGSALELLQKKGRLILVPRQGNARPVKIPNVLLVDAVFDNWLGELVYLGTNEGAAEPGAGPVVRWLHVIVLLLICRNFFVSLTRLFRFLVKATGPFNVEAQYVSTSIESLVLFGAFYLHFRHLTKYDLKSYFREISLRAGIASSLGGIILAGIVLLVMLSGAVSEPKTIRFPEPSNALQWTACMFAIVIIGPLAEEFVFRGMLLNGFAKGISVKIAAVISSIIFAIAHLRFFDYNDLSGMVVTALLAVVGLFYSYCAAATRSLRASFLAHGSYNATLLIASGVLG